MLDFFSCLYFPRLRVAHEILINVSIQLVSSSYHVLEIAFDVTFKLLNKNTITVVSNSQHSITGAVVSILLHRTCDLLVFLQLPSKTLTKIETAPRNLHL